MIKQLHGSEPDDPGSWRRARIADRGFAGEIWNWTYHDIDALVRKYSMTFAGGSLTSS